MRVLVVGGAGYIGSHMVKMLGDAGHEVATYDNLSSGWREAVLRGPLIEADLGDVARLREVMASGFDAVMHFASSIRVDESVRLPGKYYRNNVANALNLLEAMVAAGIGSFIFSSTAAVFGEPQAERIDESHPRQPINPYGRSKAMVEDMLGDFDRAHGLRSVSLRYFNAAGADPSGLLGERHEPETHLIPLVLQAASGRRTHIDVFGRDYPTPDGTCVRDYVHVEDLCRAHLLALEYLASGAASTAFNLGNGDGFSVQEVIDMAGRVSGRHIASRDRPRRAGDPVRLVADATRARSVLGWRPRYAGLEDIIAHAWRWESR
ncbi:MAG TPA: UDP-glucose 4-epimerase GalE [Burkholderiales bacterium]|jgi:UDP-glucose 4-epimerase|nr:UDP-glucose 4-epimerase GalE [Burkholderiales bacterium]